MKTIRRQLTAKQKMAVIQRQGGLCGCGCGDILSDDPRLIQFDHIQDLQFGGTNDLDNWAALRTKHHLKKTAQAAKAAAKMKRIEKRAGLRLPKMNARDKVLAKMLGD